MGYDTEAISMSDKGFGPGTNRENLQRFADAGFTHLHFDRYRSTAERMSEEIIAQWEEDLAATGMQVLDSHGCHGGGIELWAEDDADRFAAIDHFIHRLEVTKRLGGDAVVYHVPTRVEIHPVIIDRLLDSLAHLEPEARGRGMKIALENHYLPEVDLAVFPAAFERFDADYLGFTLDPGHGLISGTLPWLLEHCCQRLTILHLNENDTTKDHHWVPFTEGGVADWDPIVRAIAASPYAKPLQLEVHYKPEVYGDIDNFVSAAESAVRSLTQRVVKQREALQVSTR
ncbi:MAG: sugar phosphate isomerase/epimerase [Planctomycetota bacterium]|nr:MAG: sugar phosphate isomerase/epimerase [Planctomycetota bacterium]